MWFVNLLLAFVPSLTVWLFASSALANFVFRLETRSPELIGRPGWKAVETSLVTLTFFGSVALWIGLTMLLNSVIK